jgi:hypothetical protein
MLTHLIHCEPANLTHNICAALMYVNQSAYNHFWSSRAGYLVNLCFAVGYNTNSWSSENKQFMNNCDCEIVQCYFILRHLHSVSSYATTKDKENCEVVIHELPAFRQHSATLGRVRTLGVGQKQHRLRRHRSNPSDVITRIPTTRQASTSQLLTGLSTSCPPVPVQHTLQRQVVEPRYSC